MYGWQRSRFGPFGNGFAHFHLGQTSVQDLERRAGEAIAKYRVLVKRAGLIKDDATRQGILQWIGDGSIPGTPADRFRHVSDEEAQGAPWDEIRTEHLDSLEAANAELETRVVNGEKSGVIAGHGPLALVDDSGKLTGVGVGLVVIAVVGLFVVPLTLK